MEHIPVFFKEAIEYLQIMPEGIYVDVTLGAGGHSAAILEQLASGKLIAFDIDTNAIEYFRKEHQTSEAKFTLVNANFADLTQQLDTLDVVNFDGILADLGWSTDQLDGVPGLSFMTNSEQLDMRFDSTNNVKASDLLNNMSHKELKTMFADYGGFYGRELNDLVSKIIDNRKSQRFTTVGDFNSLLDQISSKRKHNIKPRAFQALRIAVNNEYQNLQEFLNATLGKLKVGGRLVLITFHSGEEMLIRGFIEFNKAKSRIKNVLSTEYLQPSVQELRNNIHSHSAKLWVIEKI